MNINSSKHFKTKFVVLALFLSPYSCLTKHFLRWLVSLKVVASLFTKTYIDHRIESTAWFTADNGTMHFWDWKTGYNFQRVQAAAQPGSIDSEAGIFALLFDKSGSRLITAEADKTIKIYKEDDSAVRILLVLVQQKYMLLNMKDYGWQGMQREAALPKPCCSVYYSSDSLSLCVIIHCKTLGKQIWEFWFWKSAESCMLHT